jgi:hypothetical protein
MTKVMNQSKYTITLNEPATTTLIAACDTMVDSLKAQLKNEAAKKAQRFGLFYKPTPGLQDHPRLIEHLQRIVDAR